MGEFLQSIDMMKVYIILSVAVCIFFAKTYSISLGPDPFSRGKPCTSNDTCNSALGVMCCGAGQDWGRCCPDYPKTTQSTPSYLSTTTATTTTTASTSNSSFVWNGELAMDYADEDED